MKQGPANESDQVAVVESIWGFGDKTVGTVIDCDRERKRESKTAGPGQGPVNRSGVHRQNSCIWSSSTTRWTGDSQESSVPSSTPIPQALSFDDFCKRNSLGFRHVNIRSLLPKFVLFTSLAHSANPDVLAVSESLHRKTTKNSDILIPNYNIF